MRRFILLVAVCMLLFSCVSVLRKDLMETGIRKFSFADLIGNPELYKGRLFVLGGMIVNTALTREGSQIEAVYVPVDSRGYLENLPGSTVRYLAILPGARGILDPMIYRKNRQITLAGTFTGTQPGKIDSMDYVFPVFQIEQVYLWEERPVAYSPYPWAYPYPYHWGAPVPYGWGPYWW